jgi:hypothetical protein
MNREKYTQNRVDEALECLNGIRRAEPNPYFFTRLQARLERDEKNVWEHIASVLARPAVATVSFVLIIAINAFFLFNNRSSGASPNSPGIVQNASFTEDYFTLANNSFDYENLEP